MPNQQNRKLLVSVFNAQEAREAVLGGGRIIDSEDPRSALGNIKPRQIMEISDAVLNSTRDLDVQLSTNIGEDQLLFDRSETGDAIEKSPYEIAGKAAQAAIGVACAMGTRVHPCNLIKVGVDGMNVDLLKEVLEEVVLTLNRTEDYSHCQVMSVLFAQDLTAWDRRRSNESVLQTLVELREFHPCEEDDAQGFDLKDFALYLADRFGRKIFHSTEQVSLGSLIKHRVLPTGSEHSIVKSSDMFPHEAFFPDVPGSEGRRTSFDVIKLMVDACADVGGDSIMLDTRIQSKVGRICLVDTSSDGLTDINRFDVSNGMARQGILTLEEIKYFVDYCHYRNIEANLAGSVQSYQAQQIWLKVSNVDQISTRGASSAVDNKPRSNSSGSDTRQHRVIKRSLVRGLAPPELGGVINFPEKMKTVDGAEKEIRELCKELAAIRKQQGLPELQAFYVSPEGVPSAIDI